MQLLSKLLARERSKLPAEAVQALEPAEVA